VSDFATKDAALAKRISQPPAPLPDFLAAVVDPVSKQPRNLWTVCEALDKLDGRPIKDKFSARGSYVALYQWLSNAAAHGGLGALRRLVREEQGVLHLVDRQEPMTTHWPIPVFAGHVGELARVVLDAFGQPTEPVTESGVMLPPSDPRPT